MPACEAQQRRPQIVRMRSRGVTSWLSSCATCNVQRWTSPFLSSFFWISSSSDPLVMSDDAGESPFTPEQTAWIDRMVEARAAALVEARGTRPPTLEPPATDDPAVSPPTTTVSASLSGEPTGL